MGGRSALGPGRGGGIRQRLARQSQEVASAKKQMGVMLDTSVLIGAERGTFDLPRFLRSVPDESISIASITASELLHGCYRATNAGIRARRFAFVDGILEAVSVATFGINEARRHAQIWAELSRNGKIIGPYDLLVAATALSRGDSLATLNSREFKRVPGVRVFDLATGRVN